MPSQDDAYLRHQQTRWLRPDAHRWVRPDAARWFAPGTKLESVFPALALKYNPNQPRVPSGNPDGGQWTDGDGGGSSSAGTRSSGRPRVIIDTTHLDKRLSAAEREEIDGLNLLGIKPRERGPSGVHLAGDPPPGIGDNGGPPLDEPPEIPQKMPETGDQRMKFVRDAARWLARVGRYSPLADAFFGAADQVESISRLTAMIRTANDPPEALDALRDRAQLDSEPGYQDHHIVGQHKQNRGQFGDDRIDSYENKVRIPVWKHFELNRWYAKPNKEFGYLSPRDYLRGRSWEEQMRIGLRELRRLEIIK